MIFYNSIANVNNIYNMYKRNVEIYFDELKLYLFLKIVL